MYFMSKGCVLRGINKGIIGALTLVVIAAFAFIPVHSFAQEKVKPKLVPIILDKNHTNPRAVEIARKLYLESIKNSPVPIEVGDIYADFFPLQKQGSKDVFIIAQILEPPLGCYAAGCSHTIYRTTDGKKWTGVFSAFFVSGWYDANSNKDTAANLILTSDIRNKNPGVWVWGSGQYWIANRRQ